MHTDNGTDRALEFSHAIRPDFKVERITLPGRPYCVRIAITTDTKENGSILIESDSREEQIEWIEKMYDAIQVTSSSALY